MVEKPTRESQTEQISRNNSTKISIVRKVLENIFEMRKYISLKNPGAHFTLKISANQRFETSAGSLLI